MSRSESYRSFLVLEFGLKFLVIQPCGERVFRVPRLRAAVAPDGMKVRLGQFAIKSRAPEIVAMFRLFLRKNFPQSFFRGIARFDRYAAELGVAPATLALAWVRYSAGVTAPIVGASRLSQLEDTLAAFELDLTDRQYQDVTALFATEVWEEGLQPFPGRKYNFPRLRRNMRLLG